MVLGGSCWFIIVLCVSFGSYLFGGSWWFLIVLGCAWLLHVVICSSWRFLAVLGGSLCFFLCFFILCSFF